MTTMTVDVPGEGELVVRGEIDMSNSAEFAGAIDTALGDSGGSGPLTVDLTAVEYLDSAGIHVLLTRASRIVVVTSPLLLPVLTICGLPQVTSVRCVDD
jgi:anti-anti-sigma factor